MIPLLSSNVPPRFAFRRRLWQCGGVAAGVLALFSAAPARCSAAAAGPEIVLGMSTALSGTAADLGVNMRAGVEAALHEANEAGGIHGRPLRLHALDDGYEPTRTVDNMRRLLESDRVLAIVGNVGTPTSLAAIPIATQNKTAFYGAYTGAGVLRKMPTDQYVVNYRASYKEEIGVMVDALSEQAKLRPEEIAFFTQRDAYGDAGFFGGVEALKRHGLADENSVVHVRYERNTVAVEKALSDLLLLPKRPRALIMVGTYQPCAAFIHLAKEHGFSPLLLNVSFVGVESLGKALGEEGNGVLVTQVVPHYDSPLPISARYRKALASFNPGLAPTFGSMEGYLSTRILCRALQQAPDDPSRENVIAALERLGPFDLGTGSPLALSPSEHQASHMVWITQLQHGQALPTTWAQAFEPAPALAK